MPKTFTRDEVVEMMRRHQGDRTNTALAQEFGVTKGYIGDIFKGYRNPGPAILRKLGLEAETKIEVVYRRVA